MDKHEKLLRIQSLLVIKKKEEDIFSLKLQKVAYEIYAKELNPLLINFLNFESDYIKKLNDLMKKAGGKFVENIKNNNFFTKQNYEKGLKLLELEKIDDFFKLFGAVSTVSNSEIEIIYMYEFLDQISEILENIEFAKKHNYIGSDLERICFIKYLKVLHDDRIHILKKPFDHLKDIKIEGIWEINNERISDQFIDEPSYLLGHCTQYTSYWPIISDGLKLSKSRGGRCGKGIYFSNDVSKCLGYSSFNNYTESNKKFGLIFFAQVYVGKITKIKTDNGALTASSEYDSIHAVGSVSPKISEDIWHSDGTISKIFVDSPTRTGEISSFGNNEFVIYDEKRSRLRYVILLSKNY